LIVIAEIDNRHAADRIVPAHHGRGRGVASGNFLERQSRRNLVGAGTAPLDRHVDAHQPEPAHFPNLLHREMRLAVPARRVRRKPLPRELSRDIPDHRLLFVENHDLRSGSD
jgi:hypothetical protein